MILPTTTVGSFPKPGYLVRARAKYYQGELSKDDLWELEKRATEEVIELQEDVGLDILVDGEMYRGDMVTFFAENMEGFRISGLVRSYGNRYYRKPIVVGRVKRLRPITVGYFTFAQSLTSKPLKGMLTGPYTMAEWSFNEYYGSKEDLVMDLAEAVSREAKELEEAGAKWIQIDEPAISTRPEEIELARRALGAATSGLRAKTVTHICYGEFEKIYPKLLELPVDQIDLEMANSNYDLLGLFRVHPFTKEIGLGVIDVHSHLIETKEEVKEGIKKALGVLSPQQITVDPDCGLKTRTWEESKAKLQVMVEATKEVREELEGRLKR